MSPSPPGPDPDAGDRAGAAAEPRARSFIEQARREQIVRAAIETIAEVGYAKASFAQIAKRAGISPALISYHFRGKDQLLAQVVADVTAAMERAIVDATEDAQSYSSALRGVIETQIRYFGSHTSEMVAVGEIYRQNRHDPAAHEQYESRRELTLTELEGMFKEGQDEGEFRDFATRPMAVVLMAALESVPPQLLADPDLDVDGLADEIATIFEEATRRRRIGRRRTR